MAVHTNATAGAALGNELRAGTVAQVGSTKRIQALNGMLHANRPNVDITRARAYTKIYKQTEGMPSLMRRYKASAEVYRTLSDNVYDHEQLVGWPTQKIRGANFAIELHAHWLAEDLPMTPLTSPTRIIGSWRRNCSPIGRIRPWRSSGATM